MLMLVLIMNVWMEKSMQLTKFEDQSGCLCLEKESRISSGSEFPYNFTKINLNYRKKIQIVLFLIRGSALTVDLIKLKVQEQIDKLINPPQIEKSLVLYTYVSPVKKKKKEILYLEPEERTCWRHNPNNFTQHQLTNNTPRDCLHLMQKAIDIPPAFCP